MLSQKRYTLRYFVKP